jgi:hypothetical protein
MTSPHHWERVRDLFHAALDIPPDRRHAFVEQRAVDPQVLAEVTSLLAAYPAAEGFLSRPAGADEDVEAAVPVVRLRPETGSARSNARPPRRRRDGRGPSRARRKARAMSRSGSPSAAGNGAD